MSRKCFECIKYLITNNLVTEIRKIRVVGFFLLNILQQAEVSLRVINYSNGKNLFIVLFGVAFCLFDCNYSKGEQCNLTVIEQVSHVHLVSNWLRILIMNPDMHILKLTFVNVHMYNFENQFP